MAGAQVEFEIKVPIERVRLALKDKTAILEALREVMLRQHTDRAAKERAPDGTPWKPLNPKYRAVEKKSSKILNESGRLLSLASEVQGDTIVIGTNAVYGAIHQFGGIILPKRAKALRFMLGGELVTRKSVVIPARPYLGVSQSDREELESRLGKFLEDIFLGA